MNRIDLIIYDWDGTLMDSVQTISECIKLSFEEMQLPPVSDEKAKSIIGLALTDALKILMPQGTQKDQDTLMQTYRKHFKKIADSGITLYPGVREALESLKNRDVPMAIATGKSRAGLIRDFERSGLEHYFSATRTIDECRPKPDPHMILDILEEMNVQPQNALMVGDTTYDMEMAEKAGVRKIASAYGAHPLEAILKFNPEAYFHDFEDLFAWISNEISPNLSTV